MSIRNLENSDNAQFVYFNKATISSTDNATSYTSGVLTVAGGIAINGESFIRDLEVDTLTAREETIMDVYHVTNTDDSTSTSTGAAIIEGGVGIGKSVHMGGVLVVENTTVSTSKTSGAVQIYGGIGIAGDANMNTVTTPVIDVIDGVGGSTRISRDTLETTINANGINKLTIGNNMPFAVTSTTDSADIVSGAFITSGGAAITKKLRVGGDTRVYSTTESYDGYTGALIVDGGILVKKDLYVTNDIYCDGQLETDIMITDTSASTSYTTGALVVRGGMGVAGDVHTNGSFTGAGTLFSSSVRTTGTSLSTSTSTGAIVVSGGIGVAKKSYFDEVRITNTTESTNTLTGSLVVDGGAAIKKDCNINGSVKCYDAIQIESPTEPQFLITNLTSGSRNFSIYTDDAGKTTFLTEDGGTPNNHMVFQCSPISDQYIQMNNQLIANITTGSTSVSTGSFVCKGGAGIAKSLYVGGILSARSTQDTTALSTGSLIVNGGTSIAKSLYVGGTVLATSTSTGTIVVTGGVGVGDCCFSDTFETPSSRIAGGSTSSFAYIQPSTSKVNNSYTTLRIGNYKSADGLYDFESGAMRIYPTTQSTSTNSGALHVWGGVGIEKNLYVGGTINAVGGFTFGSPLRIKYNDSVYTDTTVSASGKTTIASMGAIELTTPTYVYFSTLVTYCPCETITQDVNNPATRIEQPTSGLLGYYFNHSDSRYVRFRCMLPADHTYGSTIIFGMEVTYIGTQVAGRSNVWGIEMSAGCDGVAPAKIYSWGTNSVSVPSGNLLESGKVHMLSMQATSMSSYPNAGAIVSGFITRISGETELRDCYVNSIYILYDKNHIA